MQKLMQTTALLGVLVGLTLSPALGLAGELVVDDGPVFVPESVVPTTPTTTTTTTATAAAAAAAAAPYNAAEPTDQVIIDFNGAIAFCGAIGSEEYVIDCLSERLGVIAAKLPETGEFTEMRTAIADASAQLGALAAQNQSDTLASGVARSADTVTTRPLRPVATETLAASLQAADAIVAQTQIVLLRSSSNSQNRSLDFQRVAAVVGTSRSLLRSA